MAISESLCFVQLMHPGGEAKLKRGSAAIGWNREAHARKYMRCPGDYVSGGKPVSGLIEFWGEWEPESEVIEEWGRQPDRKPQRVWQPCYERKANYAGLQNTDPFVFGSFLYTGCKQHTRQGATQLRYLKRGSVLLFGSCIGDKFALDTAFVVKDYIDHNAAIYRDVLKGKVPEGYWDATLFPWYGEGCGSPGPVADSEMPAACAVIDGSDSGVRLYFGATWDDPVEGMFSFVPCIAADGSAPGGGFPRPNIELRGVIKQTNRQGSRLNRQSDLKSVVGLWKQVVDQVEQRGLELGVSIAMPPRR